MGDATRVLLKARTRYERARELAKGRKDAKIAEIKNNQTTLGKRSQALKDALDTGGAELPAAKKQTILEVCKDAEEKLAKITTQLDNGQFQDADYLAKSTLRQVWEAQQELDASVKGKKTS